LFVNGLRTLADNCYRTCYTLPSVGCQPRLRVRTKTAQFFRRLAAIDSERFDIDDLALATAEQHSDRQFRNILQCCDVPRLWERSNLAGHKNLLEWFWGVTTLGQKNRFEAAMVIRPKGCDYSQLSLRYWL